MNSPAYPQPTFAALLIAAAVFWAISRVVAFLNGRNDETKRIRGQFVPEWIGLFYVCFDIYGMYVNPGPPSPYPLSMTLPPLALILGPIVGLIHGTYRLHR